MNNFKTIYLREIKSYFNTPMAYIFLVVFALVNSYFFTLWFFPSNQSDMRSLFSIVPLAYLFFIPAISMSLIAKEINSGTIELVSTLPIKDVEFVVGKYLSSVTLIAIGLGLTLVHFFTLVSVGSNIDYGAVFCGYLGLLLVGSVYCSIGVFASSISDNQVVAFIVSVFVVLAFFLMDKMLIFMPQGLVGIMEYISIDYHLSNISRGVIDTRNIIYFGSLIGFFIFLSLRTFDLRRWS